MLDHSRPADEQVVLRTWGTVMRRYRRWKHLSRRDLAQMAGISAVFLGEIERGEKDPSTHSLCRIASALGVPLGELFLRVAAELDQQEEESGGQTVLPVLIREWEGEYPHPVSPAKDETAFDLYKVSRELRSDQQISLLMLARSLRGEGRA